MRTIKLSPFQPERPSFLGPSDRCEEKEREEYRRFYFAARSLCTSARRVLPFEFQFSVPSYPQPSLTTRIPMSRVSFSQTPLSALFSRVCHARAFQTSTDSSRSPTFSSFGTVRKSLDTHARIMGSRCRNRCRLRTCTSQQTLFQSQSAVFFNDPPSFSSFP